MPRIMSLARLLVLPLALAAAGCGAAAEAPRVPPGQPAALRAERDTTSIRAIKTAIKKHFEVATLDRIVTLKEVAIVPAPAWNEFVYEGVLVEDDLTTGFFTFRVGGVYDAVAKEVHLKTKDLIGFQGVDPRAPRDTDQR